MVRYQLDNTKYYRGYGANKMSKNVLELDENESGPGFLSDVADLVWAGKLTTKVFVQ